MQKLRDAIESGGWAIPPIDLAFIQVYRASRGLKKEFKRTEKVSGDLDGGDSKEDSVTGK